MALIKVERMLEKTLTLRDVKIISSCLIFAVYNWLIKLYQSHFKVCLCISLMKPYKIFSYLLKLHPYVIAFY
jgi:hypothetical protein